jgi:3-oxoadipate enol-lactonase
MFAELAEVSISYELAGGGPPVLLISGTGSDLRASPGPFAWPGAERFAVLAYDHRDLGSSVSRSGRQPTMADFAADALALVEHVGWDEFSLVGISFGGMVAQEVALAAGARVRRLVLACTSAGGGCGSSYPLHELYSLTPAQRTARLVRLLDTRAGTNAGLARAIEGFLAADRSFATGEDPSAGLLRQLDARRRHDTCARLAQIRAPTLVAGGKFDGIAPLERCERLAEGIPGGRLEVFDGGHGFLFQDPTAWPAIAAFLRESTAA